MRYPAELKLSLKAHDSLLIFMSRRDTIAHVYSEISQPGYLGDSKNV
jgi:hypothetical protein